jgi:hypothetical protein
VGLQDPAGFPLCPWELTWWHLRPRSAQDETVAVTMVHEMATMVVRGPLFWMGERHCDVMYVCVFFHSTRSESL